MSAVRARRLSRPNRVRAPLLALVAGISCGHLTDPPLPANAQVFVPPPVYAEWWTMVESCSGLSGSLANIQWYSTTSLLWDPNDHDEAIAGYWSLASNRIVLYTNDTIAGGVVRHEMLHALVRSAGHPRWAFLQACGGVVTELRVRRGSRDLYDLGSQPIFASRGCLASERVREYAYKLRVCDAGKFRRRHEQRRFGGGRRHHLLRGG
jgi:hypothetical protein